MTALTKLLLCLVRICWASLAKGLVQGVGDSSCNGTSGELLQDVGERSLIQVRTTNAHAALTISEDQLEAGVLGGALAGGLRADAGLDSMRGVLEDVVEATVGGSVGPDGSVLEGAKRNWASYQSWMLDRFNEANRRASRCTDPGLRLLVVTPVANSEKAIARFRANWKKLNSSNLCGDTFRFALFHYQNSDSEWSKQPWYREATIAHRHVGYGCPKEFWYLMTPTFVSEGRYDYVWIMDSDLSMEFFSWDLYRSVLVTLRPIVSQAAILPKVKGQKSSDWPSLHMKGWDRGTGLFAIARENALVEEQNAMFPAWFWSIVHRRLEGDDRKASYSIDFWWSLVADELAIRCNHTFPIILNGSPLRHINEHDLQKTPGACRTYEKRNTRVVTAVERERIIDGYELQMQKRCDHSTSESELSLRTHPVDRHCSRTWTNWNSDGTVGKLEGKPCHR